MRAGILESTLESILAYFRRKEFFFNFSGEDA